MLGYIFNQVARIQLRKGITRDEAAQSAALSMAIPASTLVFFLDAVVASKLGTDPIFHRLGKIVYSALLFASMYFAHWFTLARGRRLQMTLTRHSDDRVGGFTNHILLLGYLFALPLVFIFLAARLRTG